MQILGAILIPLAAFSLAACDQERTTTTTAERDLVVTGPRHAVERFVKLQHALRPPLETSPVNDLSNGRASALVRVPADYSGEDLMHTTREALAAGLSYEFEEDRSTLSTTQ